jgi:hypothetical protein
VVRSSPTIRPGWVYERKEDGWRMLAFKDGQIVPADLSPWR